MKSLLLVLALALSFSLSAKEIDILVQLSPAGSFNIKTSKVKGKVTKKGDKYVAKKLSVKIKDLRSGIELRDDHVQKRLAKTKNKRIVVSSLTAKAGKGKGKIAINGIKKPIKFTYTISGKEMVAKFKLNLDQFKVKDRKYMGVGAKKIVEVSASVPIK